MVISRLLRNISRTREILTVFFRHGFGDLVQRMGLERFLRFSIRKHDPSTIEPAVKGLARRFRDALEELGGAFVKLGQVLSTRPDVLPQEWIHELSGLQDNVQAVDFEQIHRIIQEDLGPNAEKFISIDPVPIATASVAQVHSAVTISGDSVVIKVRKPGVKDIILQDLSILEAVAELMETHLPESRNYRPHRMVQEFRAAVQEELDFTREAENLGRFATDFQSFAHIVFPQVYWDQTSERVLTMSRMEGLKISMLDAQAISTVEARAVAQNLAEAVIRQILEFGFFHGDPHPGNLLVMADKGICFLDCGMVGRLDERMRENLVLLVAAGIRRDSNTIVDILTEMNALPHDLQRSSITREIYLFLERYYRKPLKRIQVGSIIEDVMDLIRTYGIEIPPDFVLVGKALMTVEGIGRRLNPDFDVTKVAAPYVREMVLNSYGPKVLGRRLIEGSREIVRLMRDLPFDLREFTRNLRENRIGLVVEHRELHRLLKRLDQASTRISLSIVVASVVMASSVIILANHGPFLLGLPLLSILGFGIASALSFWLILSYGSKDKK